MNSDKIIITIDKKNKLIEMDYVPAGCAEYTHILTRMKYKEYKELLDKIKENNKDNDDENLDEEHYMTKHISLENKDKINVYLNNIYDLL